MKLPGAVRTGVRGLAQMPDETGAILAKGATAAQIGQTIGGLVNTVDAHRQKIASERNNEEIRQLNLSMMQSQAELDNTLNKDAYSAGEIPEGIDVRKTDKAFINGQEVSTPRNDIPAYEVKSKIYQQEMDKKIMAGAEKITDPKERELWINDKKALVKLNTTKLQGQAESDQREYNAKKLALDINNSMDAGEFDIALAMTADIKNADARVEARKNIRTGKELNEYDNLILTSDNPESWAGAEEAIVMLRDPEQKSNLTTEQRVSEADKLERALIQGQQDFAIAKKAEISNAAADVKVDLDQGSINYTEEEFKTDRDKGLLTNSQYIGYTKQLNDNKAKLEKSQKAKFEIQAGYINPKNKEHMQAVDDEFTKLSQDSDPWQATQRVVQKYNVLPPAVNNAFNVANITGGENLASAANQYNLLNETNPVAMMDVKAPRVQQAAAYLDLGMNSGQALEALALNESLSPAQLDTRKAMMTGRDNTEENAQALSSMYSDSFGSAWYKSDAEMPVFMTAEFSALTEVNLAKAGFDIDVARRMAFNTIKGKYKPTSINGNEQVLPFMPQQPDELVRKQIVKQLGKDVIIQSDQLTENQHNLGNKLSYMAYRDLGDGNIDILERFEYDPQSIQDAQAKDQEVKQKKVVDDAIKEREAIEAEKARVKARKEKDAALAKSYATKVTAQRKESLSETLVREVGL